MHTTAPQPTARRVFSLLWFPFFFAAAFALMGILAFTNPTPHSIAIDVAGSSSQIDAVQQSLDRMAENGFVVTPVASSIDGTNAVLTNSTAGAYSLADGTAKLTISSAASASRANYLHNIFTKVAAATGAGPLTYVDAVPLASGDVSGVGIMFYGLPLLLVGMITSIVLLQFGMWSIRKKALAIASTGVFASIFAFTLATSLNVIPSDAFLLLYGLLLTQAIGWLTTAAALFAKQFFMPVAMTFVLILGIPSSGATVNGDMLSGFIRWLNAILPFAQFVDITRASAYFGNNGLLKPLLILLAWAAAGGLLLTAALIRSRRSYRASAALLRHEDLVQKVADLHRVHGTVRTTSGIPVADARVLVLNEDGAEAGQTLTALDGTYSIGEFVSGLHHIVVSATHCEPEIATIAVHGGTPDPARDFELLDWSAAAGNLTGVEVSTRRNLSHN